ncbi:hypothetical protein CspeluHIS016_0700340 [Cutaneotrichosporon spelunceum]|uniref:precorrin-2 dehydrogenase n=1 Tax=Cutaneotrichosporon spelunceum TaxID=1672016 RepID=A0AAD3YEH3_9TREE|nr:hypothetical protein CspeluHIS016_0700340 [Cutaneotrichosporon spelunceum]
MPEHTYPEIQRGASLLLAWRLEGKKVLLVGGGAVAASRLGFLLEAGAHVTIVSPGPLEASLAHRVATEPDYVAWADRPYGRPDGPDTQPEDLAKDTEFPVTDFDMVFTAIDDNPLSRAVCDAARAGRVPVNVADVPPECDFYFGAQVRRGPLQVMVSTSGAGPKVAVIVRDVVADAIPDNVEDAIAGVGALRTELRERAPGVGGALSKRRMRWMIDTCDAWKLSEMGAMKSPEVRRKLLDDGWEKKTVLSAHDLGVSKAELDVVGSEISSFVHGKTFWPSLLGFVAGAAVASASFIAASRQK